MNDLNIMDLDVIRDNERRLVQIEEELNELKLVDTRGDLVSYEILQELILSLQMEEPLPCPEYIK